MPADVVSGASFTEYTAESAPPAARRFLTATRNHLGYVPGRGWPGWWRRRS